MAEKFRQGYLEASGLNLQHYDEYCANGPPSSTEDEASSQVPMKEWPWEKKMEIYVGDVPGIPSRAVPMLEEKEVIFVGDFSGKPDRDLLSFHKIGKPVLALINKALKDVLGIERQDNGTLTDSHPPPPQPLPPERKFL